MGLMAQSPARAGRPRHRPAPPARPRASPPLKPVKNRCVYRYFDPTDAFVQILLCDAERLRLGVTPGMNRTEYRRLVIETCMPELGQPIDKQLAEMLPEDPLLGEDLLYQLCVEVNPTLNIHTVRLFDSQAASTAEAAPAEPETKPEATSDDFLGRMSRRAARIESRLKRHVIGQDDAVHAVASAVRRAAAGLTSEDRPLASLMFVGRTGTGKTELGRALARELYSDDSDSAEGKTRLVRIDCSEYAHAHEYSKLIGAPPGYVGHQDGGHLTEALLKERECVVLFDEVEKAHPKLHNLMLQILEEGALTDGRGRRVRFDRAIVLLTSNAGANEIQAASRAMGFHGGGSLDGAGIEDITTRSLEERFSPEFLGRLDEIQVFGDLDPSAARKIAQLKLTDLALRARRRGLQVAFTAAVSNWVASRGFSAEYGAREIRRVIQRELEPRLANVLLDRRSPQGGLLRARIQDGEPFFELED